MGPDLPFAKVTGWKTRRGLGWREVMRGWLHQQMKAVPHVCAPRGAPKGHSAAWGGGRPQPSAQPLSGKSPLSKATLLLRGSHVRRLTEGTASRLMPCPRRTTRSASRPQSVCGAAMSQSRVLILPSPLPGSLGNFLLAPLSISELVSRERAGIRGGPGKTSIPPPPGGRPEAFTGGGTLPALVSCGPAAVKACGW